MWAASHGLSLLMTVFVRVVLAGFFGVMRRVHMMTVGYMGVVPGFLVIAGFVMLSSREGLRPLYEGACGFTVVGDRVGRDGPPPPPLPADAAAAAVPQA